GKLMQNSDVFVFPSIRELGAGVVAEAMAAGLCVLAADYGGPGGLIDADRGVKVPLASPDEMTGLFVNELERLADDPVQVRALGDAARAYALATLTWDVKARKTVEVYKWALRQRAERPTFNMTFAGA